MRNKKFIESEGKTMEEAIEIALVELKLPRKSVKVVSLSEEKKGLFGMAGAKPAKVRVSVISDKEKS